MPSIIIEGGRDRCVGPVFAGWMDGSVRLIVGFKEDCDFLSKV